MAGGRVIITREQYESLRVSGRLETSRQSRTVRATISNLHSGEIVEGGACVGCGIRRGDVRLIRWRDKPEKSEPLPRPRGRILATATEVVHLDDSTWLVVFEPKPVVADDYFLAPGAGYTTSVAASIDPEASAMHSKDVERIVADNERAKREAQKARLAKARRAVIPTLEEIKTRPGATSRERKHIKEIEHHLDQLEKLGDVA